MLHVYLSIFHRASSQSNTMFICPHLFGIALAGSFIGRNIVAKMNQKLFRKMVLVAIILVSIKFVVDRLLLAA